MAIDLRDRRILAALDKNARQSQSNIAKQLGVSKDVVNYRIKRLEEQGIIKYYYAIINNGLIGYTNYRIYLSLKNTTPEQEQDILRYLHEHPSTNLVMPLEGTYNIGFMITTKHPQDVKEVLDELQQHYKHFIAGQQVSIFTSVKHYLKGYLTGTKERIIFELGTNKQFIELAPLDHHLLNIISNNARITLIELSQQLEVTINTAQAHLKQLERTGIIQGYRCMIDLKALGMNYYKIDLGLEDMEAYPQLLEYCLTHPNCVYVDECIGGKDFELELELKTRDELSTIIQDLKRIAKINKVDILSFGHYYPKLTYI